MALVLEDKTAARAAEGEVGELRFLLGLGKAVAAGLALEVAGPSAPQERGSTEHSTISALLR